MKRGRKSKPKALEMRGNEEKITFLEQSIEAEMMI